MLIAPWTSRFHGTGMEEGPAVLAAALGGVGRRAPVTLGGPAAAALAAVSRAMEGEDGRPLALLGECTLAPAALAATRRRHDHVALVWIDAHGDLNTPATSPSGFLGGMPFAILLGWCHDELRLAAGLDAVFPTDRAVLVGARDLDPGEVEAIARTGLVATADIAAALAALPADALLHVHLDGDVLDPAVAPGVDFPAPGGWTAEEFRAECAALNASGRVVAVSVCCGTPAKDRDGRGARAYAAAVEALLA